LENKFIKVTIVTNIPTPYRNPVFDMLGKDQRYSFLIIFCAKSEPNRFWELEPLSINHIFLSNTRHGVRHFNLKIIKILQNDNPDIVITSGFSPTMIIAWIWALIKRRKHIPFSDANIHSEAHLSILHKWIRKIIYRYSHAFIGASNKTLDLFRKYRIGEEKLFLSCLAIDNFKFSQHSILKEYDLMFCGQFIDRKNPVFFSDLVLNISKEKPEIKILLVGKGPLKVDCMNKLRDNKINYYDAEFVQPNDIPELYLKSKIFVFPTKRDAWGLVANEALAAGVPVLVTHEAGVAEELVVNKYNGYVFENFNLENWAYIALRLLKDDQLYLRMSENARASVSAYTFSSAAEGIIDAIQYVSE